jgi:hypothetical protein
VSSRLLRLLSNAPAEQKFDTVNPYLDTKS